MKTAGIVIDSYKLPIFKRHLDKAGFKYTEHLTSSEKVIMLKVSYTFVGDLQPVIIAANKEAFG